MSTKRTLCDTCGKPPARCYCALVSPVASAITLVIWQHPSEKDHPKGTAPLLHACLPNSRLLVAEQLSREAWLKALGLPADTQPLLLFPEDNSTPSDARPSSPETSLSSGPPTVLLALDGTWRKARKLYYLNPWLATLPRLSLTGDDDRTHLPANYRIRKAEKPGQLSTLESCCIALAQMEQKPGKYDPILQAFEAYMRQLEQFRPTPGV